MGGDGTLAAQRLAGQLTHGFGTAEQPDKAPRMGQDLSKQGLLRRVPSRAAAVVDRDGLDDGAGLGQALGQPFTPAIAAQQQFWDIQGVRRTWFCGSYLGHGFHEDALQSGLAVAEQLGGVRRPWTVEGESGRIHVRERTLEEAA